MKTPFTLLFIAILWSVQSGCSSLRPELQTAVDQLMATDGGSNEYGWICEYSTVGMAPQQREAILLLVENREVELIRQVLRGPNIEGRVYAADALLFLERYGVSLSKDDSLRIAQLRHSDEEVRTCGNAGSYRIYLLPAREVLSDSAVAAIEESYLSLMTYGYWDLSKLLEH